MLANKIPEARGRNFFFKWWKIANKTRKELCRKNKAGAEVHVRSDALRLPCVQPLQSKETVSGYLGEGKMS